MTEEERRKGAGGKLSRSETVTVRLDPKLRYLAELASRMHRRTLSSYVEWSIKTAVEDEVLGYDLDGARITIGLDAENLWDVDDADRFVRLALRYPHLLTHEEQIKWKLIRENGRFWKGSFAPPRYEWTWKVHEPAFLFEDLRPHWETFCAVAEGRAGRDQLPGWVKRDPSRTRQTPPVDLASKSGLDVLDDDIPF